MHCIYPCGKGVIMKTNDRPHGITQKDYSPLFLAAILLLGASQAAESMPTPAADFIRGIAVGMSIACSLIGLVMYASSTHVKQ